MRDCPGLSGRALCQHRGPHKREAGVRVKTEIGRCCPAGLEDEACRRSRLSGEGKRGGSHPEGPVLRVPSRSP